MFKYYLLICKYYVCIEPITMLYTHSQIIGYKLAVSWLQPKGTITVYGASDFSHFFNMAACLSVSTTSSYHCIVGLTKRSPVIRTQTLSLHNSKYHGYSLTDVNNNKSREQLRIMNSEASISRYSKHSGYSSVHTRPITCAHAYHVRTRVYILSYLISVRFFFFVVVGLGLGLVVGLGTVLV